MPKLIGRTIPGSIRISDNAKAGPGVVRIRYAQAKLLPCERVMCSLDTTDRGGPGRVAKRWFRWFATAAHILECQESTIAMREAAHEAIEAAACTDHDDCREHPELGAACAGVS